MYNFGFPISMEKLPRPRQFGCLTLCSGSFLSGIIAILYCIFGLAQCIAAFSNLPETLTPLEKTWLFAYFAVISIAHLITLFLSTLLLVGVVKEVAELIKPWVIWSSIELMAVLLVFIMWTTMNMVSNSDGSGFFLYVLQFLIILIRIYMLMIVNSYYKQLEEEHDERRKTLIDDHLWVSV